MGPCNTRDGLFSDLVPWVGTYDLRSYGGKHRGDRADQKLSPGQRTLFVESPQRTEIGHHVCYG